MRVSVRTRLATANEFWNSLSMGAPSVPTSRAN